MKSLTCLIAILMAVAACAANPATSPTDFAMLTAAPTSSHWKAGAVWAFIETNVAGETISERRFRISEKSVDTCSDGDWRMLEPIDQTGGGTEPTQAAYLVSGRTLALDLHAGWCDMPSISGTLSEHTFKGTTDNGPFPGRKSQPNMVRGWRIE